MHTHDSGAGRQKHQHQNCLTLSAAHILPRIAVVDNWAHTSPVTEHIYYSVLVQCAVAFWGISFVWEFHKNLGCASHHNVCHMPAAVSFHCN